MHILKQPAIDLSGMWTYSCQMHWNAADICKNVRKYMAIPFCIFLHADNEPKISESFYLSRMLRIPADVKNSKK